MEHDIDLYVRETQWQRYRALAAQLISNAIDDLNTRDEKDSAAEFLLHPSRRADREFWLAWLGVDEGQLRCRVLKKIKDERIQITNKLLLDFDPCNLPRSNSDIKVEAEGLPRSLPQDGVEVLPMKMRKSTLRFWIEDAPQTSACAH